MRVPAGDGAARISRREDQRALWRPTAMAALELESIATELHFVRDHFPAPSIDAATWSVELTGDGQRLSVDLDQVRILPQRRLSVVLECAGHRRAEFDPVPAGVPWACGAVAEARWTGTRLGPLLRRVGIPDWATEVVLEGCDCGQVDGFDGIHRFARSLPVDKALHHDVILAYEMNGEPIPVDRGGPVRAIVPGWYATDSVKWLDRIWFTSEPFGGVFQAHDYRLKAPGEPGPGRRMTTVPVHALITRPEDGEEIRSEDRPIIRGVAWGGAGGVARVQVRIDAGPWLEASLASPRGPYARTQWTLDCHLTSGTHEISCRAIDMAERSQPDRPPANERGYANNAIHRVRMRRV